MAYPPVADAAILNSGMFWDACCAEGYHISHETLATGLRASIAALPFSSHPDPRWYTPPVSTRHHLISLTPYSDSRLALPPTAAVLMLTLCSIAKRGR